MEERLRKSMELNSTFLIGAFHGVAWDWVSSRFIGAPPAEAVWRIGRACHEWAHSPHRAKLARDQKQALRRRARAAVAQRRQQEQPRPAPPPPSLLEGGVAAAPAARVSPFFA